HPPARGADQHLPGTIQHPHRGHGAHPDGRYGARGTHGGAAKAGGRPLGAEGAAGFAPGARRRDPGHRARAFARLGGRLLLSREAFVLRLELVAAFRVPWIQRDAVHGAYLDALRRLEMPHAFRAAVEVDHVDLRAHGDRVVRALGLAHVAVDALVGDLQRHQDFSPRPILSFMRRAVAGWTNSEMSPPSTAISRTIVADRNRYLSDGVRNSVSTPGASFLFMPASWNSYSKSETARRPRRITLQEFSFTNSDSSPLKPDTFTFLYGFSTSLASFTRSSSEKNGRFAWLWATPTITSSKSFDARW